LGGGIVWGISGMQLVAHSADAVPEPISIVLFAPGLAVFGLLKRRRNGAPGLEASPEAAGGHGYDRVTESPVD